MPSPTSLLQPPVTIVMPVQRHRGLLPRAIASWAAQDYPRERLELIFVSNGREPLVDAQVRAQLASGDAPRGNVVYIKTDNELAQYAFGVRYARGEWLLFTEPSCLAQHDCVSQLIGTLISQGMVGGCVQTTHDGSKSRVAQIAARAPAADLAHSSRSDDWRKFTKRGFALRRDVYRSIGGFEEEYGCFGELIMAARLDAEGHRLGYVPNAVVQQTGATGLRESLADVWEFRQQLARYRDVGGALLKPYFAADCAGRTPTPTFVATANTQAVYAALRFALGQLHQRHSRSIAWAMLSQIAGARGGHAFSLAIRYGLARLRLALALSSNAAYRHYTQAASILGEWAEASYAPQTRSDQRQACNPSLEIHPGETLQGLYGFHARERHAGRAFRWTSPVAAVALDIPPSDYFCTIDCGDLLPREAEFLAFWNGLPVQVNNATRELHIDRRLFAPRSEQVLTLIASPTPNNGRRGSRNLGLPLFSLQLKAAAAASRQRAAA